METNCAIQRIEIYLVGSIQSTFLATVGVSTEVRN